MPVVRYADVLADLRRKILDGTYPAGQALPHSDVLASTYGVGQQPITRAMRELKAEGLIWRVANRGMIVQEQSPVVHMATVIPPARDAERWEAACRRAGAAGQLVDIGLTNERAAPAVADALHLSTDDPVIHRTRQADINGRTVYIDHAYYPRSLVGDMPPDQLLTSVRAALTVVDPGTGYVDQYTTCRLASRSEAKTLKVSGNTLVLDITRVAYDATGRPVELLHRTVNTLSVRLAEQHLPLR